MNQSEEMVALKKVYAEMILNTTKESAVRVMAAENKAHRHEKELVSTKEEAVRLLLRLKHMIDTQKKEAEARSVSDKRRIDELEAQLDEAEGMIIDLRAKLNNVEDQLDSLKDKYKRLSSRKEIIYLPNHHHSKTPMMDTQSYPAQSFPYSLSVSEPTPVTSEIPVSVPMPSILVHQKDIPIESMEPEVYDNGGCERVQESEAISLPKPSICDHGSMTSSKEIIKQSSGCHSGSVNSSVSASANIESNALYEKSVAIETSLPDEKMQTEEESDPKPKKWRRNASWGSHLGSVNSFVSASANIERNQLYEKECIEKSVAIETSLPDEKMQIEEESEPKPRKCRRNSKTKSLSCLRTDKFGMKDSLRNDISAKDQHGKFNKLPRRTIRYGRVKAVSSKRRSAKTVMMPQRTSVAFTRCRSSISSGNAGKSDETPRIESGLNNDKLQPPKKYDTVSFVRRSIRKRKTKNWDTHTLVKASRLNDKNMDGQVIPCQDLPKVEDPSTTREAISVKDATFNADTLENSVCDADLIEVVIVEQPNGRGPVSRGGIHVKEESVNADTLACGGGNWFEDDDDADLVDVVITEEPNGLIVPMIRNESKASVNADTLAEEEHEENNGNLVDVVILEPPPAPKNNGLASSRMKLDNTCTVPVDCRIAEVNTSRTIIHTFSRKRKNSNRSLVPSSDESSPKKQRGEEEGNDIVSMSSGNKNLADDDSYGDSRAF